MADGALVLAGKLGIGLACAAATPLALRWRRLGEFSPAAFTRVSLGFALATRAALAVALYGVLELEVLGDVLGSYVPQGRALLEGRRLYRDFSTSYGPLFPYAAAALLALWKDPVVFVAGAIALELASLALWIRTGRRLLDERSMRIGTLLYLTSPIPLLSVAMNGGNQIWVAPFLAVCAALLARRDALAGFVLGCAVVAVKLLAGIFAPIAWLFARERARFALGFALAPLAAHALAFAWAGPRAFEGLVYEAGQITPGNLYFQLSALGIALENPILAAASGAVLIGAAVALLVQLGRSGAIRQPARLPAAWGIALLVFLLLSKKSYPTYLVLGFYPFCLGFARGPLGVRELLLFGVLGIAATLEMSLWFRWLDTRDLGLLWQDPLPAPIDRPGVLGFFACELVLLASYALALRRLLAGVRVEPCFSEPAVRAGAPPR